MLPTPTHLHCVKSSMQLLVLALVACAVGAFNVYDYVDEELRSTGNKCGSGTVPYGRLVDGFVFHDSSRRERCLYWAILDVYCPDQLGTTPMASDPKLWVIKLKNL